MTDLIYKIYEAEERGEINSETADSLLSIYTEGENIEIHKKKLQIAKLHRDTCINARTYVLNKQYDEAQAEIDKAILILRSISDDIRNTKSTMGSVTFGLFTHHFGNIGRDILSIIIAIPLKCEIIVGFTRSILDLVDNVTQLQKTYKMRKKNGEHLTINDFNMYKNVALQTIDSYIKSLKKFKVRLYKHQQMYSDEL